MQKPDFEIRKTSDGSDTLYSAEWQESYHSVNGAMQESLHVFIDAGLKKLCTKECRILEVGFGTGLNALLTWHEAQKSNLHVQYTALEAYPLPIETALSLNYREWEFAEQSFSRLHLSAWEEPVELESGRFLLKKHRCDFTSYLPDTTFNLVFFDAFAPEKQPEMWDEALFARLFAAMDPGGILVTYCAKGEVRRRLQRCGFLTERLPGPPGKREMLRATKPNAV